MHYFNGDGQRGGGALAEQGMDSHFCDDVESDLLEGIGTGEPPQPVINSHRAVSERLRRLSAAHDLTDAIKAGLLHSNRVSRQHRICL